MAPASQPALEGVDGGGCGWCLGRGGGGGGQVGGGGGGGGQQVPESNRRRKTKGRSGGRRCMHTGGPGDGVIMAPRLKIQQPIFRRLAGDKARRLFWKTQRALVGELLSWRCNVNNSHDFARRWRCMSAMLFPVTACASWRPPGLTEVMSVTCQGGRYRWTYAITSPWPWSSHIKTITRIKV